jgi:hypothetical protein
MAYQDNPKTVVAKEFPAFAKDIRPRTEIHPESSAYSNQKLPLDKRTIP